MTAAELTVRLRPSPALPRTRTLRWWHEFLLIATGYLVYMQIRNAVPARRGLADELAVRVLDVERWLHLDFERAMNAAVASREWLAVAMNYYYASAHFTVTIAVAVWVLARRLPAARGVRIAWYASNLVALACYWLVPLTPPRLLPHLGYVDTVVVFDTWGSWSSESIAAATNQYAAMPSMHVGWALWVALTLWHLAGTRRWRWAGVVHLTLTCVVIVGTGNHFWLDAVGGALALAVGVLVARAITRKPVFSRHESAPDPDLSPRQLSAAASR